MTDVDPPRLTDLGLSGLDALEAARDRVPSDEAVQRLAGRLGVGGPTPPSGSTGSGSTAPLAAKAAAVKTIAALAMAAVAAVTAWQLSRRHAEPARREPPATPTAAMVETVPEPEPPRVVASPPPSPKVDAEAPPSASARPRTSSELELIGKAERALRSDPASALRLAAEHARLFPNGSLAQEREVLAIDALSRLGRIDRARSRADAFGRTYPSSPHNQRLRRLLRGPGARDGGP